MDPVSEPATFDALLVRILEGRAPLPARQAAARGALPLPRAALVRLYIHLKNDDNEQVRQDAEASLSGLDVEALREVFDDPDCDASVLDFFAVRAARDEGLAERIAFHRAVPTSALETLAARGNAAVIELVLTNQERLLSQPELLDRVSTNPALRADQRGRILELLDRASREHERRLERESSAGAASTPVDTPDLEEAARLLEVDVGDLFAASEIMGGEELEQSEDPQLRSAYRRILTLNTAQKAILAMKGGREERMILVRDTSKIVSSAVLRNPRLTEEDVEAISRIRNVSGEILRQIGQSREWNKHHGVVVALVQNPRTPQGVTTNFVPRLRNQELKKLQANHDVPELIRRMAKRTLLTRTQQSGTIKKKH
jgi:hypothetical protein